MSPRITPRRAVATAAGALAALATLVATTDAEARHKPPAPPAVVDVQLLALNDFHGQLEAANLFINTETGSTSSSSAPADARVLAGGGAYLATHVRALEAEEPNTLVVSAGDLIGASPLLSALFHDEPTIEAMNLIGLDLNAVGNHEFDEGADELRRMQEGGCHPVDGCLDGTGFEGADFEFLAANVIDRTTGQPFFPPYAIREFDGAKVAFIGMTLEGTPTIVSPSGVAGLDFLDEADTVNRLIPHLRRQGVDAYVVLLHEGGAQSAPGGIDDCNNLTGPIVDIADRMSDEIDVIVSGHTHLAYDCVLDGKVVTSASAQGRLVTDIDLEIDRRRGEVLSIKTDNLVVHRDVTPAGDITDLIARYDAIAAPLRDRVIGNTTAPLVRPAAGQFQSNLGRLIADAQLDATDDADTGNAVMAFMNPGGVRADINAGDITYGEAFAVQPFGNSLVTMTLTGTQIDTLLEQQFCNPSGTSMRVLHVSASFSYAWSLSAPCGSKVDPASITLDGTPIDPTGSYRVTVNSFMADGGDNFVVLRDGTERLGGAVDTDALEAYLATNNPYTPVEVDRITTIP